MKSDYEAGRVRIADGVKAEVLLDVVVVEVELLPIVGPAQAGVRA